MNEYVCGTEERLDTRPFTDPDRTRDDLTVMYHIVAELRALAASVDVRALDQYPGIIYRQDDDRTHRFVINQMRALRARAQFTVVGFFGHRHSEVDSVDLDEADALLLSELRDHAGMLAYCSYQYCADQYGNLVVFAGPDALTHWSRSEHHAHIAATVSPRYYSYIRLHSASLLGSLQSDHAIVIHHTKYFDYAHGVDQTMPWRGRRDYGEAQVT